ncbi:nitrate/nitrite transporter NrtS [Streptomyces sp. NPDC048581]|uniref:nitrate/nitrite transporter NrtS n=1 Tax=unclassified Streptomyces TaxID=2593676 RepID=UPI003722E882
MGAGGDSASIRAAGRTVTWTRPREAIGLLLRGYTARTAAHAACLVGTVLSAVNQGTVIISGEAKSATWARLAVNYLVPYLVAGTGSLATRRVRAAPRSRRHSGHETP